MNMYIDESGSINNKNDEKHNFVIALVQATDDKGLKHSYKRYITSRMKNLYTYAKEPKKMFVGDRFVELKGSALTAEQKKDFVRFFCEKQNLSLYYIVLRNPLLTDAFCSNTARAFNYSLYHAIKYFVDQGVLELTEECNLQLDERNERTDARNFLEQYLNTQFIDSAFANPFHVRYFDSKDNKLIQLADIFANIYYSQMVTDAYTDVITVLKETGVLKGIYFFPLHEKI